MLKIKHRTSNVERFIFVHIADLRTSNAMVIPTSISSATIIRRLLSLPGQHYILCTTLNRARKVRVYAKRAMVFKSSLIC